jgi:hypothetical protein
MNHVPLEVGMSVLHSNQSSICGALLLQAKRVIERGAQATRISLSVWLLKEVPYLVNCIDMFQGRVWQSTPYLHGDVAFRI